MLQRHEHQNGSRTCRTQQRLQLAVAGRSNGAVGRILALHTVGFLASQKVSWAPLGVAPTPNTATKEATGG